MRIHRIKKRITVCYFVILQAGCKHPVISAVHITKNKVCFLYHMNRGERGGLKKEVLSKRKWTKKARPIQRV